MTEVFISLDGDGEKLIKLQQSPSLIKLHFILKQMTFA
jgi:hypothetical protein